MSAFGPDQFKAASRDSYVGNETDTDEYRETQPAKGVQHIAAAHAHATPEQQRELERLMLAWLTDATGVEWSTQAAWSLEEEKDGDPHFGTYEGADALTPALNLAHDILWDAGLHPYCGDFDEWREQYDEEADHA